MHIAAGAVGEGFLACSVFFKMMNFLCFPPEGIVAKVNSQAIRVDVANHAAVGIIGPLMGNILRFAKRGSFFIVAVAVKKGSF